jgi:hypothetical protein
MQYWEINEGRIDSTEFFKALPLSFPEATTFFAEGTSIADDVKECLYGHKEAGQFYPGANTIWPVSDKFRCKFSSDLMNELASLSEHHAEPEMMDHLSLYNGKQMLLYWHDAFSNVMWLSKSISQTRAMAFSKKFGLGGHLIELDIPLLP